MSHGHGRSGRGNESKNARSHCKAYICIFCIYVLHIMSFFSLLISVCRQPASLTEYVVYSYIFFWVFPLLPSIKRSWHLRTCCQTKCEIHLSPVWKRRIPLKMTISWFEPSHRCWQKVTPVTVHSCPKSQCVFHQFENVIFHYYHVNRAVLFLAVAHFNFKNSASVTEELYNCTWVRSQPRAAIKNIPEIALHSFSFLYSFSVINQTLTAHHEKNWPSLLITSLSTEAINKFTGR